MNAESQAHPGFVVGGRYRLETILGEGGMAVVWKAVHTETERVVALKLVRPSLASSEQARELFVKEAKIAARIGRSEHIVDVLDAGVDETLLVPFLAMELLDGEPLDVCLRRDGPLPRAMAMELLVGLGDALDQAHGAGVIHRDLKPQNLFLARDRKRRSVLKVLDFGIAKLAEAAAASSTQIGTPAYSAPEQLGPSWQTLAERSGKVVARTVGPATDVWALGLVCFEMLVGAQSGALWGASTLAELPVKMILEPLPSAAERAGDKRHLLPIGFDAWLARCLDLDASRRFSSAGEATRALVQLLEGPGLSASPVAPPTAAPATPDASVAMPGVTPSPAPAPHAPHAAHTPPGASGAWSPPRPAFTPFGATPSPPAYPPAPGASAFPGPPVPHATPMHPHTPMPYPGAPGVSPMPMHPGVATGGPWGADPRLQPWLDARRFVVAQPDLASLRALEPFYLLSTVGRADRELRGAVGNVPVRILEVVPTDSIAEGRTLYVVFPVRAVMGRAALRSKRSSGIADDIARGIKLLDGIMGGTNVAKTIGDPSFEAGFDVRAPSPQEGAAAIPVPLRQALFQTGFTGTMELRPGVVVATHAALRSSDPRELEQALAMVHPLLSVLS